MLINLHPDDLLFFNEVAAAMRRVAKQYELPLRSIKAAHMPAKGMQDFLGRCFGTGDIELVMRATVDGEFCDEGRTPADVWRTAAHELAHLKHMNHGPQFEELHAELLIALGHQQVDHRAKTIDKLVKMQASRDSERALGNTAAAEAFAAAVNRMLIEHELDPSDLDYARANDKDPVIELFVDKVKYGIDKSKARVAWQESLARTVAKAHLCSFLLRPGTNDIWFVGTQSHAQVAEYVYGTLVPAVETMSIAERLKHNREVEAEAKASGDTEWRKRIHGFREGWLDAFIERINERFNEARLAAVKEAAADVPGAASTALIRLDGQLVKVRKYIDDKFAGRGGRRRVSSLSTGRSTHSEGRAWGKAAADRMPIGRRGVTGGKGVKGLLK
jgi:hypothetical protein